MSLLRRVFLSTQVTTSLGATAQTSTSWSNRPIKVIVPFPAGGGYDFMARNLAQKLTDSLGQPVVVENRAGADSNNGFSPDEAVAAYAQAIVKAFEKGKSFCAVQLESKMLDKPDLKQAPRLLSTAGGFPS
jgi:hypothetical protein